MWEPETLDLQELGEHEGFDFGSSREFDPFGDYENGESWENGSDYFDYESSSEASLEALEADPFLGNLLKSATKTLSRVTGGAINDQVLKTIAGQAAKVAGGAIAGPQGARIASQIAGTVFREGDFEDDFEGAYENGNFESILESSGVDMEAVSDLHYFASRMAEAESEAEADEFLGALIPILGQVAAPLISNLVKGKRESDGFGDSFDDESWGEDSRDEFLPALLPLAAPLIAQGVGALGKLFTRRRKTKKLAEVTPQIAYEAIFELARNRYPMTRTGVASAVSSATARTLANRRKVAQAMRKNQAYTRRASSGSPPANYRYGSNFGGNYGNNGSRSTDQQRGRTSQGSTSGRPRLIGYVPVYAKR